MAKRFHAGPQSGTPVYDELVRALESEEQVPPRLIGTTTVSGANTADRKATDRRNPMTGYGDMIQGGKGGAERRVPKATAAGQIPVSYVDGSGNMQVQFQTPTGSGGIGRYRQYLVVTDGAGGFNLIDDGFGNPVTTLENLE